MDVNLFKAVWHAERARGMGKAQRGLRIVLGISALPMLGLTGWLGLTAGRALSHMDPALVGQGLATGLLCLSFLSGFWDGSCALRFEPFRPFQVSPSSLFFAELMVTIQIPMKLYLAALSASWALGVAVIHPSLLPWLMLFVPLLLLWLISLERIIGVLAGRLTSMNFKLLALYGLLFLGLWVFMAKAENRSINWLPSGQFSSQLSYWLPTTQMIMGWQGVLKGDWPFARLFVLPVLWTALLLLLAYGALRNIFSGEAAQTFGGEVGQPWAFRRSWVGVARHQWHSLWNSKVGRLFLFVPLLGLDGVVTPTVIGVRPGSTWIIACLGFVQLSTGFCFNLFGFDRGGVRGFWTLPLEDRDLLVGKVMGVAAFQAVILFLFAACLPFLAPLTRMQGLSAVFFCTSLFSAHARSGMRFSVKHPRPVDPAGITPNNLDDTYFGKLGRVFLPWVVLVAVWGIASRMGSWPLLLSMVLTCLGSLALLWRGISTATDGLRLGRDHLTATLERSDQRA